MKTRIFNLAIFYLVFLTSIFSQDEKIPLEKKDLFFREKSRYQTLFLQEPTKSMSTSAIDVTYYGLDLTITTAPQYLRGKVKMNAICRQNNLAVLSLDLMNALTVDSVFVGGVKSSKIQYTSFFDITLDHLYSDGEMIEVEIYYQGVPGSSGFGSFEFSSHSSVPWVWTLSEPYGAKDWWPCNDHPSDKADSADITVTTNSSYKVGANGKLLSVIDNGDGTSTHHWKTNYPISTYLISIALTNYSQFSNWFKYTPTDSMEVLNYVLPENLSSAMSGLPVAVTGLQIFSDMFGLYPFINEKMGHAQFGWGGGMEHQTMTYLGGFSEGLVIHELAHQWFGDMITCRTWPDLWLNEGFATYCEALYNEKKYGFASYQSSMNSEMTSAKSTTARLYLSDTSSVGSMFGYSLVYAKGATVLHMLRHVVGDSAFFRAMYSYANDPRFKYGTASTPDLKSVFETESGMDLNFFFDEWVYGTRYPRYSYGWTSQPTAGGYNVTFGLTQTTGTTNPAFFTMPIDLKIYGAGWDTTVVIFNNLQTQTFEIDISHQSTSLQFDPMNWILKTKDSLKTFTVSSISRNFQNVMVNFSKLDSVTVFNTGLTTLDISSILSDNLDYTIQPTSASILPGGNQKFYINFIPSNSGIRTGKIYFYHNAPTSPDQVTVTGTGFQATSKVTKGWNMVSIPFNASDQRCEILFPGTSGPAFMYDGVSGYVVKDTLIPGAGYWLKYGDSDTIYHQGFPPPIDTIDIHDGWNMVGSSLDTITVSNIISIPEGIIISPYFGFDSTYFIAEKLMVGKSYWVKSNGSGKIILK
ncbi:MAG: peptidase M1 [Ignavibacteriales bacterium]|nr:peptidase M1 [Ignavibacteriales bacterium]